MLDGSPHHELRSRPVTTATASKHPPYRLYLLGGASCIGPAGPLTALTDDQAMIALVAMLASSAPGEATRATLAGALWPELDRDEAARALAATVDRLAALVEPGCLVEADGALGFDPDVVWTDVSAYQQHLADGERLAAAADYQGPFLDRFHLEGASAFNHWMHVERDRHAHAFRDLASALATEAMRGRDGQAAARWWTRLVDADPWNPRAALQAMEGFEAMGARPAAMAVAEEYLTRTRERLGREPDPAIEARLERLRGAPAPHRSAWPWIVAGVVVVAGIVLLLR